MNGFDVMRLHRCHDDMMIDPNVGVRRGAVMLDRRVRVTARAPQSALVISTAPYPSSGRSTKKISIVMSGSTCA
jgi:hypothetical protein